MVWQRCVATLAFLVSMAASGPAAIYRWDNGQVIPGTEGITPGSEVQLDHHELAYAALNGSELTSVKRYQPDASGLDASYVHEHGVKGGAGTNSRAGEN